MGLAVIELGTYFVRSGDDAYATIAHDCGLFWSFDRYKMERIRRSCHIVHCYAVTSVMDGLFSSPRGMVHGSMFVRAGSSSNGPLVI
jgi:hypothetical protein